MHYLPLGALLSLAIGWTTLLHAESYADCKIEKNLTGKNSPKKFSYDEAKEYTLTVDARTVTGFTVDDSKDSKLVFSYTTFVDRKIEKHTLSFNVSNCDRDNTGTADYTRSTIGVQGKSIAAESVDAIYTCECGVD